MIKTTFKISGEDFSQKIIDLSFPKEVTYRKVVETLDGKEHNLGRKIRPIIQFRLMISSELTADDFGALVATPLMVQYVDPDVGLRQAEFRLDSDLSKIFAVWNCIDESNWYYSEPITLRAVEVL